MQLNEIHIRDPFILVADNAYYLYGTKVGVKDKKSVLDVYKSGDMKEWSSAKTVFSAEGEFEDAIEFWAPEVHQYNNKFYMFVSIKKRDKRRGTYILACDTPDGKFVPHSNGAITPEEWECLDGTLYIENGKPYMVFCHEWVQVGDGEIWAVELSDDLRAPSCAPIFLFKASSCEWAKPYETENDAYVTDGPFLFKENGNLYMIWSSFIENRIYAIGLAYSDNGCLSGEWKQMSEPIYKNDGGHAMIFEDLNKVKRITFHNANNTKNNRVEICEFCVGDFKSIS